MTRPARHVIRKPRGKMPVKVWKSRGRLRYEVDVIAAREALLAGELTPPERRCIQSLGCWGMVLLGCRVRFLGPALPGFPDPGKVVSVRGSMVEIEGLPGLFAPDLFELADVP